MKRIIKAFIVGAVLLSCLNAHAATTWTKPAQNVSLCTESTGTGSAPTLVTDGLLLADFATVQVCIQTTGAAFTAGSLLAYLWDPSLRVWLRAPDLDLSVAAGSGNCFIGINFRVSGGKLAYIPSGLGAASVTYLTGWRR